MPNDIKGIKKKSFIKHTPLNSYTKLKLFFVTNQKYLASEKIAAKPIKM
jgi:hypothetical protein